MELVGQVFDITALVGRLPTIADQVEFQQVRGGVVWRSVFVEPGVD
ncbi:hypothetical protein [Kribbella capetownensis]|nr:hypothetical protein [Kribbella capetownensis]